MWCFSQNKEARVGYIKWVKSLATLARRVYRAWLRGDSSKSMPIGMFAPRMPTRGNLVFR